MTNQDFNIYDIAIVGGGIHGATIANFASQNNLKVLLIEKNDYASGTSSRSSKMLHGGLRYLEMLDFQQVFEGIKARDEYFKFCSEIAHPSNFLIPVNKNDYFYFFKLKIGLILYDLFLKNKSLKHKFIPRKKLAFEGFDITRRDLLGCFEYYDGAFNDTKLVLENILRAKNQNALCLNYHQLVNFSYDKNLYLLNVTNTINQEQKEFKAKILINTAGCYVPEVERMNNGQSGFNLKYSRGSHILFNKKWNAPSLFLPLSGKARYYFVWPFMNYTMVGTTEREMSYPIDEPLPTKDEIQEIYNRLEKDLPNSGLNSESAYYCFAGIRALPARESNKGISIMSRKHLWSIKENIISLYGGKLSTASWTAKECIDLVFKKLNIGITPRIDLSLKDSFKNVFSIDDQIDLAINKFDAKNLEDLMREGCF